MQAKAKARVETNEGTTDHPEQSGLTDARRRDRKEATDLSLPVYYAPIAGVGYPADRAGSSTEGLTQPYRRGMTQLVAPADGR